MGEHDKTRDEFNKDWEWTVEAIKLADLEDIFNGKDTNYKQITFFGIKDYTLKRMVWTTRKMNGQLCETLLEWQEYMATEH